MNRSPLCEVTQADQERYREDGVVLIKQAFDSDWVKLLLEGWERIRRLRFEETYNIPAEFLDRDPYLKKEIATIKSDHAASRKLYTEQNEGFVRCKYMRWWAPEFRDFAMESPAAEVIGKVIGARYVRFFLDAMFMKEPNCQTKTYWHADQSAWPIQGDQVPTMWMPLLPVSAKLSSLEYVAGSHKDTRLPWPNTFNAKMLGRPADGEQFVDYEKQRGNPNVRFLAYDMEPGDVVIMHPATYHGGGANLHPTLPRIALSTRWFGDNVVWDPRPECINTPGISLDNMVKGKPVNDDALFPVLWRDPMYKAA